MSGMPPRRRRATGRSCFGRCSRRSSSRSSATRPLRASRCAGRAERSPRSIWRRRARGRPRYARTRIRLHLAIVESAAEVRVLSFAGVTRPQRSYDPVRLPPEPPPEAASMARPPPETGLPRLPRSPFQRAVPTTPADQDERSCRLLPRPARPSPSLRRVGIRIFTFEACSGFTRVTAHRIARPPKVAFLAGLQPSRLPDKAAPQLPDQTDNYLGGILLHW